MSKVYTQREVEAAVAISGDLHAHRSFESFLDRHHQLGAIERWQLCIEAGVVLERCATEAGVVWGHTHDFYFAIEILVDQLLQPEHLDLAIATSICLASSKHSTEDRRTQ